MKTKLKTPNDGAAAERAAIRRYISRLWQRDQDYLDGKIILDWIDARTKRCAKRAGGLGRK